MRARDRRRAVPAPVQVATSALFVQDAQQCERRKGRGREVDVFGGITRRARAPLIVVALLALAAQPVAAQQKLVVYSSNEDTLHNVVFPAFRAETGTTIEPVSAGSGVIIKRIHAEKEQPRGDVVWGISRQLLEANKALFAPYVPASAAAIEPQHREAGGLW